MTLYPHWAVERGVFSADEEARLLEVLSVRDIAYFPFMGHEFRKSEEIAQCAVARGSCFFVRESSASENWPRELWGTPEQFGCQTYYPIFRAHVLNETYRIMSLAEFCWTQATCFQEFGGARQAVFLRPNDGFKSFEGALVSQSDFEKWVDRLRFLQVSPSTQLLISTPASITVEWRVLIVDRRVVGGSQYKPVVAKELPDDVRAYAGKVAQEVAWPVRAYALDVGLTSGGFKVLEASSLLCVAWYESDAGKIVDALQPILEKVYT